VRYDPAFSPERPGEIDSLFRTAFDHAPIGMTITGLDASLLRVNRAFCELLGYQEDELVGRPFPSVSHPDDARRGLELQRRALAGEGDVFQLEKRYLHKLGHPVWARVTVSLVRDGDGSPLYTIAQVEGVGERRRAEELLHKIEGQLSPEVIAAAEGRAKQWRPE